MNMPAKPTDWQKLYRLPVLQRPNCWQKCSSYCCHPQRVYQHLGFLKKTGADLLLFPGELKFLQDSGKMQPGFAETLREIPIHLDNERGLRIYQVTCNRKGRCADHDFRPVICRLYPLSPVVHPGGQVVGLAPFALFDTFFPLLELPQPCEVRELSLTEVNDFLAFCHELLQDPINIFLVMAAEAFKRHLVRKTREYLPNPAAEGEAAFIAKWERLYLFGKLIDKKILGAELTDLWVLLEEVWGREALAAANQGEQA